MLKWLLTYSFKYWKHLIIFVLLSMVTSMINQSVPKFIQHFIDVVLPSGSLSNLYKLIGLLIGLLLVYIMCIAGQKSVSRVLKEMPAIDIQKDLVSKLRYLGFSYADQTPSGEILKLFNHDLGTVKQIFSQYIPNLIINGFMLLSTIAFMLSLSPLMTLMLVPALFIYYTAGPYFSKKSLVLGRQANELRSGFHKNIYDGVSSIPELRVNQREKWHANLTSESQQKMFDKEVKQSLNGYLNAGFRSASSYIGIILAMLIGAGLVSSGSLSLGTFIAFLFYFFTGVSQSTELIKQLVNQRTMFIQLEKIYEIFTRKSTVEEAPNPKRLNQIMGEIRIENVHFSYPNQKDVLQGVSLVIEAGKKVALVGPSGGGKTTLFKLLGRFYDPSAGNLRFDGVDYKELELSQLREAIGFVFQETYLFGTTVLENIKFAKPDATPSEIVEAAKAAYAHDFITQLPNGYETEVGERGVKLSGGQKQRIAIARMFLKNPPIICLDEATSALDNMSEKEVKLALERLCSDRTVVAIAHRLTTIGNYDEIVVIDKGRVVEQGDYEELAAGHGLFATLVHGTERGA